MYLSTASVGLSHSSPQWTIHRLPDAILSRTSQSSILRAGDAAYIDEIVLKLYILFYTNRETFQFGGNILAINKQN